MLEALERYEGGTCQVKVGEGMLSEPYPVQRGVKQGPVLSPALFLLVMDPLLKVLEQSGLGLSVSNFYAGGYLHADDIRTLASSTDSLEAQVSMVKDFAARNFLELNDQKCEIVTFSRGRGSGVTPRCEVDRSAIPMRQRNIGRDLMASRQERINKISPPARE